MLQTANLVSIWAAIDECSSDTFIAAWVTTAAAINQIITEFVSQMCTPLPILFLNACYYSDSRNLYAVHTTSFRLCICHSSGASESAPLESFFPPSQQESAGAQEGSV